MSKNKLIFWAALVVFISLTVSALWSELNRETSKLKTSISGVILAGPGARGIIKTDNAYVLLFDPETLELVATHIHNPFLPPITFSVGQADTSRPLSGYYRMLVLTDKDGDPSRPSPGEVIGPLTQPILLGTEGLEYTVDSPFQSFPKELLSAKTDSPETSIRGTVSVHPDFNKDVSSTDRMVIMLFDPVKGRPVAIKILANFSVPQNFSIGQSNAMGEQVLRGKYSLRILTDKNNQPFQAVPGEIIGRSENLIPLGIDNLEFVLDQPYNR
ncbi:MAG: hypothetical protein H8E38_05435 [SAR324 cluster bacterium]|nr:hypothetical protein [SAR324 cluster bacterium]MBL7034149.1 hypothetical protein [SAR324 cluster bacterium]